MNPLRYLKRHARLRCEECNAKKTHKDQGHRLCDSCLEQRKDVMIECANCGLNFEITEDDKCCPGCWHDHGDQTNENKRKTKRTVGKDKADSDEDSSNEERQVKKRKTGKDETNSDVDDAQHSESDAERDHSESEEPQDADDKK